MFCGMMGRAEAIEVGEPRGVIELDETSLRLAEERKYEPEAATSGDAVKSDVNYK